MAFLSSLNIGGSALSAHKTKMNIIAQNIANANTTRTEDGGAYRRKIATLAEDNINEFGTVLEDEQERYRVSGVMVAGIVEDPAPLKPVYNPSHPDADENGYVILPNVDTVAEMVDMIATSRSYEANVTAFNSLKLMASNALNIGK